MSRGVNKIILLGHVGKNPQVHATKSGGTMCSFSLGTQENWTDKTTGQKKEHTEWHKIVCFNKLADIVIQYVTVGAKVYVEGSLKTRKWEDKESGADRYTTEVIGREINIVSSKVEKKESTTQVLSKKEDFYNDDIPF